MPVSIDFSPEAYQALERIARNLGVPKNEALRRAIGLMRFLLKEMDDGWVPILEKGRRRRQITSI
jgi:hypothetical protein